MHIISKKILREFWWRHPQAQSPLVLWHTTLQHCDAQSFAELKMTFGTIDWVGGFVVFDIGGNKYRLIADVVFSAQLVFVKQVYTHKEYEQWKP